MIKQKTEFYSLGLNDAISLAYASMEGGHTVIIQRADFHAADIARYDAKHPTIKTLKALKASAEKFETNYSKLMRGLK